MKLNRPLPPTYWLLGTIVIVLLHFLLSGPRLIGSPWRFLGVVMLILGAWVCVWADAIFKKHKTAIKPNEESRVLVTEGPFRVSRHPMYLGFLAMLAGSASLAGTTAPILAFLLMVWLFTTHFVIPEERHMEEQFGEAYRDYKARVRRWL